MLLIVAGPPAVLGETRQFRMMCSGGEETKPRQSGNWMYVGRYQENRVVKPYSYPCYV